MVGILAGTVEDAFIVLVFFIWMLFFTLTPNYLPRQFLASFVR